MRMSDWSSDVCSSDLSLNEKTSAGIVAIALTACFDRRIIFCKVSLSPDPAVNPALDLFELLSCPVVANPMFFGKCVEFHHRLDVGFAASIDDAPNAFHALRNWLEIGRAAGRENVCQYV